MISIAEIQRETAAQFGLSQDELLSSRRTRRYAWPRQVAMVLSRELTNQSYLRIGRNFGKDHTTVLHAVRQVKERADENEQRKMDEIRAAFRSDGGARAHLLAQKQAAIVLQSLADFLRARSTSDKRKAA